MSTRLDTPRRCRATGATTASILAVIFAMTASTLLRDDAPKSSATEVAAAPAPASTFDMALALGAAR